MFRMGRRGDRDRARADEQADRGGDGSRQDSAHPLPSVVETPGRPLGRTGDLSQTSHSHIEMRHIRSDYFPDGSNDG
ncbi:hypothetical protein L3i22_025350 [Actinoplanes sp. L3-i22]|nr:hypothetical protein L3i22_025350 [Actinoplanes sp. L3-i22]